MESLPPSTNASYFDQSDRSLTESSMESVVSLSDTDQGNNGNAAAAARGKRPAWNVPSNDSVEAGPVMGGISWPSLSQSTKASPRSSTSPDSLKALSAGTVSDPPGPAAATSPQSKPSVNNSNANPNSNQKSVKHAGGGGGGNGSGSQAPPLSPLVQSEKPKIIPDKLALQGPTLKTIHNNQHNISSSSSSSNNNPEQVSRGGAFLPQPHDGNDHHRSYVGNRRGNNGGGGPHFGSRQDQNRGNEWNHRNFGNRDAHLQQQLPPQQRGPRPYFRPPALASAPFIPPFPPSARPFMGPIYPEIPSPVYYVTTHAPPESFRGVRFPAHPAPPAVFFPQPDPLQASLLRQVEHYFSRDNLVSDLFLRGKMDAHGWVPISLIAGFKKVKEIMQSEDIRINTQYILETMPASTLVEVQVEGEKIRKRGDWMEWLLPARSGASTTSLSAQMHAVGLGG